MAPFLSAGPGELPFLHVEEMQLALVLLDGAAEPLSSKRELRAGRPDRPGLIVTS
jgi:hypothetical protein